MRVTRREIAAGRHRGALHGLPIAVKDLYYTKGVRTEAGARARLAAQAPPPEVADLKRQLDDMQRKVDSLTNKGPGGSGA